MPFLLFLYVTCVARKFEGRRRAHSVRHRNDTKELLIQDRQREPARSGPLKPQHQMRWATQPGSPGQWGLYILRGKPRRPPLHVAKGQMDLDEPGFPVVLRNNFAAVIFALIVQGAVFVRGAFLPASGRRGSREKRRGISIVAHAARHCAAPTSRPDPFPAAARPSVAARQPPPLTFPPAASQGAGVLPGVCGEREAEVPATPGSPQPAPLARRSVCNR